MTSIEWTDRVWNPLVGCSRVSKGCEHCYAERVAHRGMSEHHRGLTVLGAHGPRWTGEVRLVPEALSKPLSWRKPCRVFVNSMSDLFHEKIAFETVAAIFGVMAATPRHTYQVLTKRPERARAFFKWIVEQDTAIPADIRGDSTPGLLHANAAALSAEIVHHPKGDAGPLHVEHCADPSGPWPLPNVWLGVSVEDQATADARIPVLLELPAALRWVSYEPALGTIDFTGLDVLGQTRTEPHPHDPVVRLDALRGHLSGPDELGARLDWVVVGGESGPNARPFDLWWARRVLRQCRKANVPVFVKQLGAKPIITEDILEVLKLRCGHTIENRIARLHFKDSKGKDPSEWPEDLRVREWPGVTRG